MSKTTLLLETLAWLDSLDVGELPNEDNEHDLSRIIVPSSRSTVSTGTSPANSRDNYYEDERDVVRNRPRKDLREAEIMTSPISIKSKSPNKGITSSSTSPLRIRAPSIFPGISFAIDDDRSTEDDKSSNQSKQNIPTKAAMVSHMTSPIREKRRNSRSVETLTSPGLLAWQAKEDKSEQSTNQDEEDVGNESTSQHRHSFDVESTIEIRDDYLDRKEYERSAKQRGFKKWQHWTKQHQVFVKAKQQQLSLDHNDNHEDKHILWTNERILMRIPAWHSFLRLVKGIRMWKRFIRQRQHFRKHFHLQALLQHKHRHRHHISLQIIPVYIMKYRIHLMITFWRLWQQRRHQKRRKHFLKWKRLLHMTASIHKLSRCCLQFMKRVYWKKWKRRSKWPLVLTLRTTRMQRIALKCWQMSTLTESGLLRSQRRHQQRARFFVFQKYLQRWIDHTILVFQLVHAKKIARQKDQLKRQFQVLFHWLEWATQHHPLRCRYEIAKKRYSSRYLHHWITYTTNNWSKRLRQRKGIRRYVGKYLALWKDMASTRRRQLQRLQNHTSHGFMLPIMRTPAFASLPGSVQAYLAGSNQHAKYHYCIDMWRKRSCFVKLRQRLGLLQSKRKSISSRSWRLYLLRYLMLWRYRIKYVIAYQGRCLTYANIHYCKRLRKKYLLFWLHRIQHTKQCQALSRYPRLKRFISSWQQWLYQKRYQQQICSKRGQLRFEVNALTASLRLWHRWSREEKTLRVRYHVFQQLYPALSHDQLNVRKIFLIWKHDYLIYARRCKEWQCRQAEKLRRRRLNMALTRWLDGFELHRIHQCQLRRACCHWYQFTDKMKTWRRHVITLHRIHEELVTWQSSGHPQSLVDFVYKQLYEYHHHHRHVHELFKACYLRRLFIDWKFYSRNSRIQRVTHRELHHRNSQQCAQVVQRRQHVEQILFPLALQQRMWKVWLKYVITRKLISRQISWKYFGRMYFMRWLKSYNYLVMARSIYQVLPQFNPTDKDVSLLSAITSSSIAQHKIAGDLSYLSIQQQSRHRVHGKESSREGKQASQDRSFVKDIVDWKIPASKRSVGTLPRREDEQPKQRNLLISAVVKKQGDEGDLDNAEDDDESSIMSEDSMTCSQSQYSDLTVEDNSQLPPSQHVMSNHIFVPVNTSISQHESNTSITSQAMRKAVDSSVNASVLNSTKGTLQSRKTTSFASMGSTSRISTGKSLQIHAKIVSKVSIDKENNHNSKLSVPRQSVSTKVPTHRIRLDEEELQNRSYLHHYQVQKEHKAETSSLCTGSSRSIL